MGEVEPEEAMALSAGMPPGLRRACWGKVLSDRRFEWADVPVRGEGRGAEEEGDGDAAVVVRGEDATEPALNGGFFR